MTEAARTSFGDLKTKKLNDYASYMNLDAWKLSGYFAAIIFAIPAFLMLCLTKILAGFGCTFIAFISYVIGRFSAQQMERYHNTQ